MFVEISKGKLRTWILKPLMWALRYEALYRTGVFPKKLKDLKDGTFNQSAKTLIDTYDKLNNNIEIQDMYMKFVIESEKISQQLIHSRIMSDQNILTTLEK